MVCDFSSYVLLLFFRAYIILIMIFFRVAKVHPPHSGDSVSHILLETAA